MFQLAAATSVELVVDRHVVAMRKEFRWPALSAVITNIATAALVLTLGDRGGLERAGIILALLVVGAVQVDTDGHALAWFGMWAGLRSELRGRRYVGLWVESS